MEGMTPASVPRLSLGSGATAGSQPGSSLPAVGVGGTASGASRMSSVHSASMPELRPQGSRGGSAALSDRSEVSSACSLFDEIPSVTQLREARKRADLNAQTLANRIAFLREEGEKACKRLEVTKMRTQELDAKPIKAAEHEAHLHHRLEEIRAQQRKNRAQVERGQQMRKAVWNAMQLGRRQNAMQMKEDAKTMQASKRLRDEERMQYIQERAVALRERGVGKEKKRMLEEARMEQFKKNREEKKERGAIEVLLRSRTEKRIAAMEREEAELLEWLQAKQVEQREAYDDLGAVVERRRARMQGANASIASSGAAA